MPQVLFYSNKLDGCQPYVMDWTRLAFQSTNKKPEPSWSGLFRFYGVVRSEIRLAIHSFNPGTMGHNQFRIKIGAGVSPSRLFVDEFRSGYVLTAGQPYLKAGVLIRIDQRFRREIPHGVPARRYGLVFGSAP